MKIEEEGNGQKANIQNERIIHYETSVYTNIFTYISIYNRSCEIDCERPNDTQAISVPSNLIFALCRSPNLLDATCLAIC